MGVYGYQGAGKGLRAANQLTFAKDEREIWGEIREAWRSLHERERLKSWLRGLDFGFEGTSAGLYTEHSK